MGKHLLTIFQKSLSSGTLTEDWKTGKLEPINKPGSKTERSNYRQISLTCRVWKLLEHIVLRHIIKHLEEEEILTPCQHGFRKSVSTATELIELALTMYQSIDQQKEIDSLFLDFPKGFDSVKQEINS